MTQSSILWTNNSTGDGVNGGYTQAQHIEWMRALFAKSNGGGVSANYLNELAVTGTASPIAVNTGAAVVYGFIYFNGASENIAVPTPSSATRIDRIVLRADWTAQTVRIARVAGSEGGGAPSLTQTPSTTWEVPLAQVSITTGGVITVTDQREYIAGVGDGTVTAAKIADNVISANHILYGIPYLVSRQGGSGTNWVQNGNTNYDISGVGIKVQVGNVEVATSGGAGSASVIFPTSYAAGNSPIVLANISVIFGVTTGWIVERIDSVDSQVNIYVRQIGGTSNDYVGVSWLAIGPE